MESPPTGAANTAQSHLQGAQSHCGDSRQGSPGHEPQAHCAKAFLSKAMLAQVKELLRLFWLGLEAPFHDAGIATLDLGIRDQHEAGLVGACIRLRASHAQVPVLHELKALHMPQPELECAGCTHRQDIPLCRGTLHRSGVLDTDPGGVAIAPICKIITRDAEVPPAHVVRWHIPQNDVVTAQRVAWPQRPGSRHGTAFPHSKVLDTDISRIVVTAIPLEVALGAKKPATHLQKSRPRIDKDVVCTANLHSGARRRTVPVDMLAEPGLDLLGSRGSGETLPPLRMLDGSLLQGPSHLLDLLVAAPALSHREAPLR
mmetsp:Transcript_70106/g.150115  ORF Transcript_70106/g.150115 Transcript_70106/m.150115 type:complete len:315 (+) Transcript_70106:112-1056(+)